MKALSIRQPWAWAILYVGKDIENRAWRTAFRGRVLIHAGKRSDQSAWEFISPALYRLSTDQIHGLPTSEESFSCGAIVGSVDIVDCVEQSNSRWFVGPFGFVLRDPRPIKPFPCVGKLGFFEVPNSYDEGVEA